MNKRFYFSLKMVANIDCPDDDVASDLQVVKVWAYETLGMPVHLIDALVIESVEEAEVERVEEVDHD